MSFKKRLIKTGYSSIINKIIKIAEQLLLVPFFIKFWGASYYGEWLTLTTIPTIIGLSDLGFGTAAANSFILNYAANKKQEASNISKSGYFSITLIISFLIFLSIALLYIFNMYNLFDKLVIPKNEVIISIYLLMMSKIICFYQPLNEAYFKAARKFSESINLTSIFSGLNIIFAIFILFKKSF